MQRKDLDINIVNKEGKTSFQLAIENNNCYFLEEILKLNPQLCFIDQKGNSVFHSLITFICEQKINNYMLLMKSQIDLKIIYSMIN